MSTTPPFVIPIPSKYQHYLKLAIAIAGVVAGGVTAVLAPSYAQPVAAVISFVSGLFGVQEVRSHQASWQAYAAQGNVLGRAA